MKQFQNFVEYEVQNADVHVSCVFVGTVKDRFRKLNVPVAELAPNKVVKFVCRNAKLVAFEVCGNFLRYVVEFFKYPLVRNGKFRREYMILADRI